MRFGSVRRFAVVVTLTLFALVSVGQGVVVTSANAKPTAAAKIMDMSSQDHSRVKKDCCGTDTAMQSACQTFCANAFAVLAEPVRAQTAMLAQLPDPFYLQKLLGRHDPPDPHPPKSTVLI